jgi:peptidoglycan/LPS O-acetylase OafA/YrhL
MKRYAQLDAARGILILAIVCQHIYWVASGGKEFWWGHLQLPVNAFIVLAGFTSAMSLAKSNEWLPFIRKRLRALVPMYLIALGLGILIDPPAKDWWAHLLSHLTLTHGIIPTVMLPHVNDAFTAAGWFVGLLVQLYLLAPLLWRVSESWLWRLFALSLFPLFHPINWRLCVYYSPYGALFLMKLYLFIAGMLLYRYWPSFGQGRAPRPLCWLGANCLPIFLFNLPILELFWR